MIRIYRFSNRSGEEFRIELAIDEDKLADAAMHMANRALSKNNAKATAAGGALRIVVEKTGRVSP